MARITVEQKALTDPRFDLLGMMLGCDRHGAIGRTLLIWNECQERERYDLPCEILSAILGHPDGSSFFVKAGLGEETEALTVRIKGTEGRIEWLAHARAAGKRGGRPKLNHTNNHTGNRTVKGSLTQTEPKPNPPAPAPAPAQKKEALPPTPQPRKRGAVSSAFKPPAVQEVQAYLDELGERRFTGEVFVASYASQGWVKNNGRPVKDWKGCVTTWRTFRDRDGEVNPDQRANGAPPRAPQILSAEERLEKEREEQEKRDGWDRDCRAYNTPDKIGKYPWVKEASHGTA